MKLQGSGKHGASSIIIAVLVFILIPTATAFQFYLHSGEQRCFTESVRANTKVLGEYTVSTGEGTMHVDMLVTVPEENLKLYQKKNIDHGKFAFIVPFRNARAKWHALAAEVHRKQMLRKVGDVFRQQAADSQGVNTGRKLLSSASRHYDGYGRRDNVPERQFDEHGRAKIPAGHEKGYQETYQASHHRDGAQSRQHEHHNHEDHHDDDFDDDFDDFDMDDYDGIHDEQLDDEMADEEAVHLKETRDGAEAREQEVLENRKFQICVTSEGAKSAHKRRVRLIIHKGETAHDYTRLAKREHMTQLEVSMRRISDELRELMNELMKARHLEDSLRKINENTNGRVVALAAVSIFSLAAVSSYQAMYTKRFLKRKKVL